MTFNNFENGFCLQVPDTNIQSFKFLATFAMVPKAKLIVYYLNDGEIVSDHMDIEFGEDLQNFVSIYFLI